MSRLIRDVTRSLVRTSVRKQSVKAATSFTDADLQNARPFKEIPGPKGLKNIPFIGTMLFFKPFSDVTVETIHKFLVRMVDQYGPLIRVNLPNRTVLVVDPSDVETVMRNEGKYPERQTFYIHDLFCEKYNRPNPVVNLQGAEWHAVRTVLNRRMMHAKSAQHYLSAQNEVANTLVERLKENRSPEELNDLFYKYACESISVVVFNKRLGYLEENLDAHSEKMQILEDIRVMFECLNKSFLIAPPLLKRFNLDVKKRYFEAVEHTFRFCDNYYNGVIDDIKKRQAEGTLDPDENNFMLSLLLTDKLTPGDMSATAVGLFIAGTDSTAKNLQITLYNMARNPDKQEKLHQEIVDVIGRHGDLSGTDLAQMPYLLASVKESMRLIHPTSSGSQRFLPNDIILKGYRIPAKTSVITLSVVSSKSDEYFPDPESFIPERWLRDKCGQRETKIPPMALAPFGFGARQCVGKRFAEQEIYLAVVKILQNFRVTLAPDQKELEIVYLPFVSTTEPIKFIFNQRN